MSITLLAWVDTNGVDHIVACDAIVRFQHTETSEITEHPIENGSVISDHVIHKPPTLLVEVLISNTPILPDENFASSALDLPEPKNSFKAQGLFLLHSAAGALIGAVLGKAKSAKSPYILQATSEVDRIVQLQDKLLLAQRKSAAITIEQYGRSYVDYSLVSVALEIAGNGQGGKGKFRLELKQVRTVQLATTELPDPEKFHAKPSTSRGSKPSTESLVTDPAQILPQGSVAYLLTNKGFGAFSGGIR